MKIEEELELDKIENKFATHYDAVEQQLKSSNIGLKKDDKDREKQRALEAIQAEKTKQKRQIKALSFNVDEEEDEHGNDDEEEELQIWFLQKCLELLRKEFIELKTVVADQLMYVKEDLILPHHYSFYEFIVTKARGKSGPLFQFDVHDDVRMISNASVEKE
ncbi:hypothetical protein KR200_004299 [Drosophila serrata]|nr:hypothetical protein KR200_004299 [Drosophila serrata]